MILKNKKQIELMRKSGLLLHQAHMVAKEMVEPGISTAEINAEVEKFIASNNAIPLFKGVPGIVPFPAGCCMSTNEGVVHGIPSARKLVDGDILSIDIGVRLDGWCSDCACTHAVGKINTEKSNLMTVTEDCLRIAIKEIKPGVKWSVIAKKMAKHARNAGFSVVENLVGHGIGEGLWEAPEVPNYYTKGLKDFKLKQGLVIAVEPMINAGVKENKTLKDHWTIVTNDHKPSAHFEHCIVVTPTGAEVLTCGAHGEGWAM